MPLPPFPVDDATLDLLDAALDPRSHGDPDATRSCVADFLEFMSQMGGSNTGAVGHGVGHGVVMVRDPGYHVNDVIKALVDELRRQRAIAAQLIVP